ncbi:zinc finger protein 91-like isoform X2 [Leptidea sinapis]|uniref:Protein krueppel n=1 Tax=Leptidea sinapis TaxID=189913 RepID=A0A5E4PVM1_9NEOP|nr:zinc finger protein 91-like isoform X2 [Leptidea sinapis]VVC89072.1 unnamed protein product [Leptidea sinapis]
MTVYLTKKMLSKLNRSNFSIAPVEKDNSLDIHWLELLADGSTSSQLSKKSICRVCAKKASKPISDPLYDFDIMGALRSVSNISLTPDDSLPKFICPECLESLKVALSFKRKCEAADRRYKKLLNPMGDPTLHSYPYSKHDFQLILHDLKKKRLNIEAQKEKDRKRREKFMQRKQLRKKEFQCSSCDNIFDNKDLLFAHRQEKQCMLRACDICGQLVYSITKHMRHIHKQTVIHKCPTCGKEFPIIARLKNHMLIHTNTFNFFCDLCPYKCKYKHYLVMHMRTHTGEKPYGCPVCPAKFVNPSNLNKHKLTHQEKQYKCMMCDKSFRTSPGLREHHEAAHLNIKHTCAYCGRDFCYKSDLRKHEIRMHNRLKKEFIGGEPAYKQAERIQKEQDDEALEKWRQNQMIVTQPPPLVQATFVDQNKEYLQNSQMYFTDVTGIIQQQMPQQQSVQITLADIDNIKKDDVKMYVTQQLYF